MICLICRQPGLVDGFIVVPFARGEMKYMIQQVPAQVCPSCNETYVEENVAERLLQIAEELSKAGVFESITEYNIRS